MDVGLHHGGIHAHSTPVRYSLVLRYFHHSFVNLLDHLRPERHAPAADGFGVGHLGAAHPAEVAVHQVGTHFALQHLIAPIADVLEDQQAQNHLRRGALPATAAALGTPLRQSLVHRRHQQFIRQNLIGVLHPIFAKIVHLGGDQSVAEAQLRAPHLNHGACSGASTGPVPDAAARG